MCESLQAVQHVERLSRAERVDVEAVEFGADGIAFLLLRLDRGCKQRQVVESGGKPSPWTSIQIA